MRRITLWLFSTVAALVLLFSYRTSTGGSGAAVTAAVAPVGDGGAAGDAGTGSVGTGNGDTGNGDTGNGGSGTTGGSGDSGDSGAATPSPTSGASGGSGSSGGSGTGGDSGAVKTYTGSVVQTRWGPVQVSITVSGGKITDVAVPVYPSENGRDQEINARALPVLRQETLAAQSAAIDAVSGATVTSDGYLASLQSALDAAHLT